MNIQNIVQNLSEQNLTTSKILNNKINTVDDSLSSSILNNIIDYNDFISLVEYIKKDIPNNRWYTTSLEDLNIYLELLEACVKLLKNLELDSDINTQLANIFKLIFLIHIHEDDIINLYTLFNSYTKLSENQNGINRDRSFLIQNFWETLIIPVAIKQHHLILIKILELWFGFENDFYTLNTLIKKS